jgi:hypothetical protein
VVVGDEGHEPIHPVEIFAEELRGGSVAELPSFLTASSAVRRSRTCAEILQCRRRSHWSFRLSVADDNFGDGAVAPGRHDRLTV